MPSIVQKPPVEFHRRMAVLCDAAAASFASKLSTATDPRRREQLGVQVKRKREAAAFHRKQVSKLEGS